MKEDVKSWSEGTNGGMMIKVKSSEGKRKGRNERRVKGERRREIKNKEVKNCSEREKGGRMIKGKSSEGKKKGKKEGKRERGKERIKK